MRWVVYINWASTVTPPRPFEAEGAKSPEEAFSLFGDWLDDRGVCMEDFGPRAFATVIDEDAPF